MYKSICSNKALVFYWAGNSTQMELFVGFSLRLYRVLLLVSFSRKIKELASC